MGFLDKFRKKKKTMVESETKETVSELEKLCGEDKETYKVLINTMFLDPRKIGVSMEDAFENAKKFEKEKDLLRAKVWYEIAGGLAIYEGNVKKVVECFSECERLSNVKYPILKNPEKAVAIAQKYYKKYLQS